jgi:predicted kinase
MPNLYILVGIPGCGKSTFSADFVAEGQRVGIKICHVSRDDIRMQYVRNDEEYFAHETVVFNKYAKTVAEALANGSDVVADATHVNQASRTKLIRAIDKYFTEYTIHYVYFDIPVEKCLERNAKREGRARVPEEAIRMMARNLRKPTAGEDPRSIGIWEIGAFYE